jgi:nucleoside-diphosphate kinase
MALEKTFAIIKPDAVAANAIGGVLSMIEKAGLRVIAMRLARLTKAQAEGFYAVHKARPFFNDLVSFMTSGPSVLLALEGDDAIARYRALMGPTDSAKAPEGTIRKAFGASIERNAVHGSDGPETAKFELSWFFDGYALSGS